MDATILGSVFVAETQLGIPGLVVTALDVGAIVRGAPVEPRALLEDPAVRRFGSTLTDAQGRFAIVFNGIPVPAADPIAPARPVRGETTSLVLVVSAPEGPGDNGNIDPLFISATPRQNVGTTESFAIRIPAEKIVEAGLIPPAAPGDPEPALATVGLHETRARVFDAGLREVAASRVEAERERRRLTTDTFDDLFASSISRVPRTVVRPERQIKNPAEIAAKNRQAISEGMARYHVDADEALRFTTRFHLTEDQVEAFQALAGEENRPLTAAEMKSVLLRSAAENPEAPVVVLREEPLLDEFLQRTNQEKCAEEQLGLFVPVPPPPPPDPADEEDDGLEDDDIKTFAAKLLETVTPPEAGVTFGVLNRNARPDNAQVQTAVDRFVMRPGPADQPSLFDFNRLQFAFDHVWQELLDNRVLDVAREVNRLVRDAGGNPQHASHANKTPLRALRDETLLVETSGATLIAPPTSAVEAPRRIFLRQNPGVHIPGLGLLDRPGSGVFDPLPPERPLPPLPDPPLPPPLPPGGFDGGVIAPPRPQGDSRPRDLINQLEALLAEPYSFTIYGAEPGTRSVNFGIVLKYRQRWEPVAYQAGELVKTIALAPGEVRKCTIKHVLKRRRAEKEVEASSSLRRDEMNQTTRSESEIVRKALAKTNFSLNVQGTFNIELAKGESTTQIGRDVAQEVQDTKRQFREAVIKAAQEYKQERSIEVTTEVTDEVEKVETAEIVNKNEELTCTYLFYELQRRYRVSEELFSITPVVMIAQEVPNPAEITEGFLLAHDWILRQVLLDPEHIAALDYLAKNVEGDRLALQEMRINVEKQRRVVDQLNRELVTLQEQANRRYEALVRAVEERAGEIEEEDKDSFFSDLGQKLGIGSGQSTDAARVREDAARDAEQRAAEQVKELTLRLQREVTALNESTEKYTKLLRDARNRQVQILRLRVHVKMYVLHYVQAILAFESPDQRFLRLHQVKVPTFAEDGSEYQFNGNIGGRRVFGRRDGGLVIGQGHDFDVRPKARLLDEELPLEEVADLGEPLGFHGNYMIFPLKRSNALTEILTAPYVDSAWELIDPSAPSHLNRSDFARYVCFLHERLSAGEFDAIREDLKEMYRDLLLSPELQGQDIVVPTNSVFIEALPGSHALLEDFKLAHRAIDVKKAQAEARSEEIENLRKAYRLLEKELGDPEIDKVIAVGKGASLGVVTDDD